MTFDQTRRACYTGYVTQAIVNNLAPLLFIVFQTRYHISYEMLGRLAMLNFGTQLVTDFVAIHLVDRIGYRRPLVLAHVLCTLGLILLAILPSLMTSPYLAVCLAIVVYSIGGGLLEVIVSPVVDALPGEQDGKAAAMSLLHAFYCWGQVGVVLGTTLLLAWIGQRSWQALPLLWAFVPLVNIAAFARVPLPATVPDEHRTAIGRLFTTSAFGMLLALMLCAGAAEVTMVQWSSLFAEQGLHMPKVWGDIAGPCLFAVFMGTGRFLYGLLGTKIALIPALTASGALATACYVTASLARDPVLSLAGCAFCGLATSLLWPGTLSLSARRFPLGGAAMFGVLALAGDAGASIGPWVAGAVADATTDPRSLLRPLADLLPVEGLRGGLLLGTIFTLGVCIIAACYGISVRSPARPSRLP